MQVDGERVPLLHIFMVAAPLLQAGYDVSLPRSAAGPAVAPMTVALDKTGGLRLNGKAVGRKELESELRALLAGRSDRLVLFDVIRRAGGRIGVGLGAAKSSNQD